MIVSASTDGHTFTAPAAVDLPNAEGPDSVVFAPASAQWVQIQSTSSYSSAMVSVEEFEVFAAGA